MERILSILTDVFLTWQVLAVAVVFMLFWGLIRYVANPRAKKTRSGPKRKAVKKPVAVEPPKETEAESEAGAEEEDADEPRPARRRSRS
jgi:hypothetical protein